MDRGQVFDQVSMAEIFFQFKLKSTTPRRILVESKQRGTQGSGVSEVLVSRLNYNCGTVVHVLPKSPFILLPSLAH